MKTVFLSIALAGCALVAFGLPTKSVPTPPHLDPSAPVPASDVPVSSQPVAESHTDTIEALFDRKMTEVPKATAFVEKYLQNCEFVRCKNVDGVKKKIERLIEDGSSKCHVISGTIDLGFIKGSRLIC